MINLDLSPKKIKRLLIVRNINILKNNLINNNDIELLSDIISIDLNLVEDSEFIAWEKEIIKKSGFNNLDSNSINTLTRLEKEKDTYKYILETTDAYNDNDISSVRFNGNIKKIRIFKDLNKWCFTSSKYNITTFTKIITTTLTNRVSSI